MFGLHSQRQRNSCYKPPPICQFLKIYIIFLVLTRNSWQKPGIQGRTSWLTRKLQKFKTKNRKRNQVAQKSARNETKTGIPVSATSWFRQEDFGFVCSLLPIFMTLLKYSTFYDFQEPQNLIGRRR